MILLLFIFALSCFPTICFGANLYGYKKINLASIARETKQEYLLRKMGASRSWMPNGDRCLEAEHALMLEEYRYSLNQVMLPWAKKGPYYVYSGKPCSRCGHKCKNTMTSVGDYILKQNRSVIELITLVRTGFAVSTGYDQKGRAEVFLRDMSKPKGYERFTYVETVKF